MTEIGNLTSWPQMTLTSTKVTSGWGRCFKRGVLQLLGVPPPPPYYILGSKIGNILHAKLRMGMSDLNAHQYSVQKTLTPSCHCKDTPETTNHFITQCPLYTDCRFQLFSTLSNILHFDFSQLSRDTQTHMLLHGTHISADARDGVVRSFHDFLFATKRFRHWLWGSGSAGRGGRHAGRGGGVGPRRRSENVRKNTVRRGLLRVMLRAYAPIAHMFV